MGDKMSGRYDQRTTTFDPNGRLLQVEYAIEHINQDGSVIGVLAKDGIVVACEKKETSKLFVPTRESGKLYKIDDHIVCAVSGVVADANYLVDYARLHCQQHLYSQHQSIYAEELVKFLCNEMHTLTQYGSSRPYGVGMMYGGYDSVRGFQLYNSDPSGNYAAWMAHATGKGCVNAISQLKDDYKESNIDGALDLAVSVLAKAMDLTSAQPERFEVAVMHKDAAGNVVQRLID